MASPAVLSVLGPDGQPAGYGDDQLIIIPGASAGEYQIKIIGTGQGEYHLHLGQIVSDEDIWTTISGAINPGDEIVYLINFNPDSPLVEPFADQTGEKHQASARAKLTNLKNQIESENLSSYVKRNSLSRLNYAIRYLDRKMFEKSIVYLYQLHYQLAYWQSQNKLTSSQTVEIQNKIMDIISDLEFAYLSAESGSYSQSLLNREISSAKTYFSRMEKQLKNLANQGNAKPEQAALYSLAEEKLNLAKSSSNYQAHINALGAKHLSLEGIKFIK